MTHLPGVEQMEEVLNRLQALSPDELRAEIIKAGLNCGPITGTTRALFEKKLGNAILENQSGGGKALKPSSSTGASPSSVVHDGEDFGYSLGLNPPEEQLLMSSCISSEDGSGPQEASQEAPSQFYGVCLPLDDGFVEMDKAHVYENRTEAMKAVKKMKGARFKIFSSREDAERFAKGSGESCSSPGKMTMDGSVGNTDEPVVPELDRVNGERANGYKTPRTQDMTAKLRKAVEKGDLTAFSKLVWSNPRYLIGSGDNPTIVQEGCRYNVMHVAARENQPGIAQLLLDTLENMEFMRLMYPDDQEDMLRNRIHYIVDLYLNTPDKAAFETPLHFACKFGCPEVVNVLCSHPDTDKNCKNKYNQKPFSVICERKNKTQEVKQKIREYLEDKFYVPLLRATDNSSQPVIGAPWSPECLDPVPHWLSPELPGSPKDPIMIVRAIAGPFSQTKAVAFRRMWKTPPRDRATYFQHMLKSDPNRGAEQVGRELAHELGYLWVESWEFLGTFIDLATPDGLEMLEEYLSTKDHSKKGPEEIKNKRTSDHVEKCPPGNIQNICNSITVGAFLDEDAEVAPDEEVLENMRGATLRRFLMTCDPNSPEQDESQGWLCSPGNDRSGPNPGRHSGDSSCTFPLPISNLMAEFEKASVMDLNRQPDRSCERGQEGSEFDDASSISSEEYFTAEESEDEAPTTGHISSQSRFRNRKLSEDGSESSASSYKSLHSSHEDLMPKTPPPNRQDFFIEGASPTKLDSEVLSALKAIEVDPQKYPCVNRWRNMIQGFTSSQMQSWPSPMGVKNRPRTPGSPCSPVLSPGSPSPARCRLIHRLYQSYLSHFPI